MNTSVALTDLLCNENESYGNHISIRCSAVAGKIQLPHVNESYGNTDTDDQMY